MKIGWIADHFYPDVQRGAELEDYYLIREARRRGYEIVKIESLSRSRHIIKTLDLLVVANYIDNFNIGELLSYLSKIPYVHIEHDLRAPQMPYYPTLANGALINVYHSPYHKEFIERFAGDFKHFLHPMCLPKEFADLGFQRFPQSEVLYVGDYSWEKGYREMAEWLDNNEDRTIWHFGGGFPKTHPRMKEMGYYKTEMMPQIYNVFQSLIFLPKYPQACSRIIAEAYLCKVQEIITNGKDGFTSYGWTADDYERVRHILVNGHITFWTRIEELIK